jgi:predicted RNA methylase
MAIDRATTNVTTTVKAAQVSQPAFWYRSDNEDSTDILSFLKIKIRDPLRSQNRVVYPHHQYHYREYVHRSYSVNGIQFRTIRHIPEASVPLLRQNRFLRSDSQFRSKVSVCENGSVGGRGTSLITPGWH